MTGYRIGSQAWYDVTRRRLLDVSMELRKPETAQDRRDQLYNEQLYLVDSLLKHSTANHINNPIE